jgi:hypothetical protein
LVECFVVALLGHEELDLLVIGVELFVLAPGEPDDAPPLLLKGTMSAQIDETNVEKWIATSC